jgi:hypothetical protein
MLSVLWALSLAAHAFVGITPDAAKTPGVANPKITQAVACATKWGKDRRHVTLTMNRNVAARYGVPEREWNDYEFDHLISRENGGADDELNLWPQPRFGEWNAGKKDALENRLHKLLCSGELELEFVQHVLATDWITEYQRIMRNGGRHHRRGNSTGRNSGGRGRSRY